jgi:uncharacterized protein
MTCFQTLLNTIKTIAVAAVFTWTSGALHAQPADVKRDLAVRIIAAQEGAEMNRMLEQIAASAAQQLVGKWNPALGSMPADKRQKAAASLDAELKKFNDDALKLITTQAVKVRGDALASSYAEKFSEEELKQLLALMEAPAFKKYQTLAPELGNVYLKGIVDGTRNAVESRGKAFDTAAAKIVGAPPAASNPAPTTNPSPATSPSPASSGAPAKKP